jgi:hypothetical protein
MCISTVVQKSLSMILSRIIGVQWWTVIVITHIHITNRPTNLYSQ